VIYGIAATSAHADYLNDGPVPVGQFKLEGDFGHTTLGLVGKNGLVND
jgi:hypothetical protein